MPDKPPATSGPAAAPGRRGGDRLARVGAVAACSWPRCRASRGTVEVDRQSGGFWRVTFSSLKVPNYRIYFAGQSVSLIGTWMQMAAQSWLVLTLTHSSTALGLAVALQTLPVLLLGPYGGVIADRADKRRLMLGLQAAMGVQALVLGLLTVLGAVRFWEVCVLAVVLGLNNAFENSARQSFVREMVGKEELRNAITLNSVTVNAARAIGPAVGGVLIATVGTGICFLLNAGSFVAVVTSLLMMDRSALRPSPPAPRAPRQLRDGLRYAASVPTIAVPLAMMAVVGLLAYEFQVTLPVFASHTFHSGSEAYGFLTAATGVGAVVGGLFTAARGRTGLRPMIVASTGFGIAMLVGAFAPLFALACVAMLFVGWASVSFIAIGNSTIQLSARPEMRGRVIALWQVAFQGTTPIGGPLVGWIIALSDPRTGIAVGGLACLVAALGAFLFRRRSRAAVPPLEHGAPEAAPDAAGPGAGQHQDTTR
ncbi:MFS transporter [Streptacidiphilus sp. 4-A2]|nr:MFS transporter [Streptacidiphilus sp. 4-A2]